MSRTLLKTACLAAALAPLFAGAALAGDPGIQAANLGDQSYPYGQVYNGVPYNGVYGGYNYTNNYPAMDKMDPILSLGKFIGFNLDVGHYFAGSKGLSAEQVEAMPPACR